MTSSSKHRQATSPVQKITPRSNNDLIPLSFAQQRLWFLAQLEPNNPFYNVPIALHLQGQLQVAALHQSLEQIIQRHEVLRTTFGLWHDQPIQIIVAQLDLPLPLCDLRLLPAELRLSEAQRLAKQESQRPFDLARGPLLRVLLLRLDAHEHWLLLTLHHIVIDHWGRQVLLRELSQLYNASVAGMLTTLDPLPIQYADYALWQQMWLQGAVLETQRAYWQQQLAGAPLVLDLPFARRRPATQSFRGARYVFELPNALAVDLKQLSRRLGSTVFMTLLAAFQILLMHYTGQNDILLGSPIANRGRSELEGLIGFFANTLVLRANLAGDPTFRQLLKQVRKVCLEAYAYQDLPFEQLVDDLQVPRDLSRNPLIQVVFAFKNMLDMPAQFAGLTISSLAIERQSTKIDLSVSLAETTEGLEGRVEYSTDLFETQSIVRLVQHFQQLLEGIVAEPELRISQLPLLSIRERQQLLYDWNTTQTSYPRDSCVHLLFEEQVARAPEAIALVFQEEQLTYHALNQRANQLAYHLRTLGIGPERLVGLCLERSIELIISLLGILKAGGAYVPLDPTYPQQRLTSMLNDTHISLLLTSEHLRSLLPPYTGQILTMDTGSKQLEEEGEENPPNATLVTNLLYVMYTSGSTGQPKGISVTHRNVVRLVKNTGYARLDSEETFLQFAPISFDASTFEIWGALLNGARLVIAPSELLSLQELQTLIHHERISTLWLTAGLFHQFVEQEGIKELRSLRQLLAGGDVLSPWHVQRTKENLPDCTIINGYGPTENTTFTCCYPTSKADGFASDETIPIGWPIANTQVYVLDPLLQPVPIGCVGELYTSGDGLARGYLHQPDQTAEHFIPHPFCLEPGVRLYRTGDLVRYRLSGVLEFIGRADRQVKLRGYRIEPKEIEVVLNQHPLVHEAIVQVWKEQAGDKRLVAYIITEAGVSVRSEELRAFLRERLPDYMLPATFVSLEHLPLTPNGKIDRNALPAPLWHQPQPTDADVAPLTPLEDLLAGIWSELLAVEPIYRHHNFFELGGHSLLAAQLVARLHSVLEIDLPLRMVFEAATLADLAQAIESCQEHAPTHVIPPLGPMPRPDQLPLSFAQQRLWFLAQLEPTNPFYNVPITLRLQGQLHLAALQQSLEQIVQRHEVLRTIFGLWHDQPIQIIAARLDLPLPLCDLQLLPPELRLSEAQRLTKQEGQRPFDLARGPLLRARLLRLEVHEHWLLLNLHHIVIDQQGREILLSELSQLYNAHVTATSHSLKPLPVQYADFALWQRQWLQAEVQAAQRTYWREHLTDAPLLLTLPIARPRPEVQSFQGSRLTFHLHADLTSELKRLSRRSGVTLFMMLLAAFQVLLLRYSGQSDILVGSPMLNRARSELEGLIGFFTNTLVLRTHLAGNPTFQQLLQRVRQVCLQAYAHQDWPFEQLVDDLRVPRTLSHNPLVQVMFSFSSSREQSASFSGLTISSLSHQRQITKLDLTMSLRETAAGLEGGIEYSTELFEAQSIARLSQHFQCLLAGIVATPDERLSHLPLLTAQERQHLLVDCNATARDFPRDSCVHTLFEQQVALTPDAIALINDQEQLTYGELNRRANQLAHYLQKLGVGPEYLVGLCMKRSLELIVSFLSILKAGGAYVPLDPDYPPQRLAFMLQDLNIRLLLTQEHLLDRLPGAEEQQYEVLCLDNVSQRERLRAQKEESVASTMRSENLAYVIYTSGSTGVPKGVGVPHSAIVRLVCATNYVQLEPFDCVAQAANSSFDACTFEIWGALLNGASLVLMEHNTVLSPQDFATYIDQAAINTLFLTTALFNLFASEAPRAFRNMHHVLFGGEAVDPQKARVILRDGPPRRLLHVYGPTENTTFTLWHLVQAVAEDAKTIPIGHPISNDHIYVLDRYLCPTPIEIPGELYIGGEGLARGYLHRPDQTAERFVPHPFAQKPGERLYRTGDLVRYNSDGVLEFLGRADQQVKIRGFRVELGEIEAVLQQHPLVRETVVLVRDEMGDRRLVAYLVTEVGASVGNEELRAFLRERLPDYMQPAAFVLLKHLPLTPNGKIDRNALPAPLWHQSAEAEADTTPLTPMEDLLAGIWSELLTVEPVHQHHNFFELGGHSLLAAQLTARLRSVLEIDLPLRTIFESATLADLAQAIESCQEHAPTHVIPPLGPMPRPDQLPLSFAQQRLWFLHQVHPDSAFYNVLLARRLQGPLRLDALHQSLQQLIQRHEVLRTTFGLWEDQPIQVIAKTAELSFPLIDLTALPDELRQPAAQHLTNQEGERPFNLQRGPLLRVRLLRLGPREHWLLLNLHHIVIDQQGREILLRELSQLYNAHVTATVLSLKPLPVQYADFTLWQRQWLQAEVQAVQRTYWREQLADAPLLLTLPIARPRPEVQSFQGAFHSFSISPELHTMLRVLSQRSGVTLFMTLLAAFQVLLLRYSGQSDILVGSPMLNRARSELEGLIGFFTNTLVIRSNLAGNPTFQQLLQRVRQVCLQAYAHQDWPFEQLVDDLRVPRTLSHNPLVQVMFSFSSSREQPVSFGGLTISALPHQRQITKLDLTMSLRETAAGLEGGIEYSTELFEAQSIARLSQHFQCLLAGIVATPDERLPYLPLLTEQEWQHLLVDCNATARDFLRDSCVHTLFEQQVARTPDVIALVAGEEQLTYEELNRSANQLAHYLRSQGVGPEVRVGLFLPRTPLLLLGLLATLKAGGAYIPLDPNYPHQRLAFMCADSQPALLLFHSDIPPIFLSMQDCSQLCLDTIMPTLASFSSHDLHIPQHPASLAYLIYTSGSTGLPKGALVSHQGLCNLAIAQRLHFGLRPSDRLLQFASLSFDASIWEICLALLSGATLILPPVDLPLIGQTLHQVLRNNAISAVTLPPSTLTYLPEEPLPELHTLIVAGEACPAMLAKRWGIGRRFFNAYGPTELTVCATVALCQPQEDILPIGHPIANTQVYVLDEQMQPVPTGCMGELYLGGVGIARGYHQRPEQTAERFVPHPFVGTRFTMSALGARVYKTGDLVRYRSTGELEFIRRADQQIKLRGYRIEPEEIKAVLEQHQLVQESVIQIREEIHRGQSLVAYIVPTPQQAPDINDLRTHLKRKLPDYMIPAAFVILEKMPLTANGKIDHQRLTALEAVQQPAMIEYSTPQNGLEQTIVAVWQKVLHTQQVGMQDNFFDLGGYSLLLIEVQNSLQALLHQEISIIDLFKYPTVRSLAAYLSQASTEEPDNQPSQEEESPATSRMSKRRQRALRRQFHEMKATQENEGE